MKTIPEEYEGRGDTRGFHYKLIERNEAVALYDVIRVIDRVTYHAYEVIVILFQKSRSHQFPDGRVVNHEAGEFLPRTEDWGAYGFSFDFLDHAKKKFTELSTIELITKAIKLRNRYGKTLLQEKNLPEGPNSGVGVTPLNASNQPRTLSMTRLDIINGLSVYSSDNGPCPVCERLKSQLNKVCPESTHQLHSGLEEGIFRTTSSLQTGLGNLLPEPSKP